MQLDLGINQNGVFSIGWIGATQGCTCIGEGGELQPLAAGTKKEVNIVNGGGGTAVRRKGTRIIKPVNNKELWMKLPV
jgi:hypothetical protein